MHPAWPYPGPGLPNSTAGYSVPPPPPMGFPPPPPGGLLPAGNLAPPGVHAQYGIPMAMPAYPPPPPTHPHPAMMSGPVYPYQHHNHPPPPPPMFQPSEPVMHAPHAVECSPPSDAELEDRIRKTAQFTVSKPAAAALLFQRRAADHAFSFLHPGDPSYGFFLWAQHLAMQELAREQHPNRTAMLGSGTASGGGGRGSGMHSGEREGTGFAAEALSAAIPFVIPSPRLDKALEEALAAALAGLSGDVASYKAARRVFLRCLCGEAAAAGASAARSAGSTPSPLLQTAAASAGRLATAIVEALTRLVEEATETAAATSASTSSTSSGASSGSEAGFISRANARQRLLFATSELLHALAKRRRYSAAPASTSHSNPAARRAQLASATLDAVVARLPDLFSGLLWAHALDAGRSGLLPVAAAEETVLETGLPLMPRLLQLLSAWVDVGALAPVQAEALRRSMRQVSAAASARAAMLRAAGGLALGGAAAGSSASSSFSSATAEGAGFIRFDMDAAAVGGGGGGVRVAGTSLAGGAASGAGASSSSWAVPDPAFVEAYRGPVPVTSTMHLGAGYLVTLAQSKDVYVASSSSAEAAGEGKHPHKYLPLNPLKVPREVPAEVLAAPDDPDLADLMAAFDRDLAAARAEGGAERKADAFRGRNKFRER